jgi:hypothetical protein
MPFNIPNQTSYIKQRPVSPYSAWTRQPDWITITDTTGEVQFLTSNLAFSAFTIQTTFTQTGGVGNIYIDWGDGTTDTVSTIGLTNTSHTYTTPGTPCSLGYDTYKVRIYGDAGTRITRASFTTTPTQQSGLAIIGVLEAYYGNTTVDNMSLCNFDSASGIGSFMYLEYLKFPSVMNAPVSLDALLRGNTALAKVIMPQSLPNVGSMLRTFEACVSLQEITLPQDLNPTSMNGTFIGCSSLTGATFPSSMNATTNIINLFYQCYNLTSIKLPALPVSTSYNSTFFNCRSLITIEIPSFTSGATTIDLSSMFIGCSSLEYVKMPTTVVAGTVFTTTSMFQNCINLKSFIFPTNFNASTLASMFQGCSSLSTCIMPTSMPSLTSMVSTFNAANLQEITLPTTVGATIDMTSTFNTNYGLSKVEIPSSYNITTLATTFSNCWNLNSVILPTSLSACTSLSQTFQNCYNIRSITLPSSMPLVTTMLGMCLSNNSLETIVLPTSDMNSCTNIQNIFNGCFNLTSVSFPNMNTLAQMNTAFVNCYLLKTITLPPTTNTSMLMPGLLSRCLSLETLTLPTTQTTGLFISFASTFANCPSLKTINNVDKLGNPSTASTNYADGTTLTTGSPQLLSLDFYMKFSKLDLAGTATVKNLLNTLRIRNNGAGQYAGTSPQINISYTDLSQAALVQVFNDLPTVTAKTINITGATGAAALTAPERAIATGKGWTITG